jgi:periplasmic copper chaperone A
MSLLRALPVLLFAMAAPVVAQVTVTDAWVRGTVPGQHATGAFMNLQSPTNTTLVGAETSAAANTEIHKMAMDNGVMRMAAVDALPLPAGKAVQLQPGGFHLMLTNLKQPLKEGDTVAVKLTFRDAGGKETVTQITAPVRALTAPAMKH